MPTYMLEPVEHDPFKQGDPDAQGNGLLEALKRDLERFIGTPIAALDKLGRSLLGETEVEVGNDMGVSPIDPGLVDAAGTLAGYATAGGAAMPKPENSLGIFGGKMAKTADYAKMHMAQDMERNGASPDEIWKQTGWFQGVDGKWRFEIPDAGATFNDTKLDALGKHAAPMKYFLDHPELYEAYPSLRNVEVGAIDEPGIGGRYDPSEDFVELTPPAYSSSTAESPLSISLHELQHAIQSREGWAKGGAPNDPAVQALGQAKLQAIADANKKLLEKQWSGAEMTEDDLAHALYFKRILGTFNLRNVGQFGYHVLAGEAEARNVQTRLNKIPAGYRSSNNPLASMDVPPAIQIIRDVPAWNRSNVFMPGDLGL